MASVHCSDSLANPHRFLKIILSDIASHTKLMIPTKFVRKYGKYLHDRVFLKALNGSDWPIDLERNNGEIWLHNGWPEFARFYSICFGYLLVFEYWGDSNFHVIVFDQGATEINYPLTGNNSGESINSRKGETKVNDSSAYDVRPCKRMMANGAAKDANHAGENLKPKSKQYNTKGGVQSARDGKKNGTLALARSFKSKHHFFISPIRKSHVDGKNHGLCVKKGFKQIYVMCKDIDHVILQVGGRYWHVDFEVKWNKCRLNNGWDKFVNNNSIMVGDACVFELINPSKMIFRVSIYRATTKPNCKGIKGLSPVTSESEKDGVSETAKADESQNPMCIIKMHPSYVSNRTALGLPKNFVTAHITKGHDIVKLQVSDGRAWPVMCRVCDSCAGFTGGWKAFVQENNLVVGDVCTFQLIGEKLLKVVISRTES